MSLDLYVINCLHQTMIYRNCLVVCYMMHYKQLQCVGCYLTISLIKCSWEVPLLRTMKAIYLSSMKEGTDPRFVKLEPVFRCSMLKCGGTQR